VQHPVNGCEKLRVVFKIAIQPDLLPQNSFSDRWVLRLTEMGHQVELVSVSSPDFLERVSACDGFLWWFPPIARVREVGKVLLSALDHSAKVLVHPDLRSCWHFDDKIAQAYLLQAAGIPTPKTWVFWRYDQAMEFLRTARYPLVTKLSSGVRSENVALLRDRAEATRMARRMFGAGVETLLPRRLGALRVAVRPLRNALRFALGQPPLQRPPVHRNSMLVQEFVEGNEFDTRVTVIGNRAFAFRRANRPNDFRASGSHLKNDDPAKIELDAIRLAFETARTLRMPALCFDILRRHGQPVITEISYYFNAPSIRECPGHWRERDAELEWVEGSTHAEDAVLDDFLARLTSFRNKS
jgi:glutathione synthase/RimK-type ligase-like ATP-grasp enzyme